RRRGAVPDRRRVSVQIAQFTLTGPAPGESQNELVSSRNNARRGVVPLYCQGRDGGRRHRPARTRGNAAADGPEAPPARASTGTAVHPGLPRKRNLISADGHFLFHRPPQSRRVCANAKYPLSKAQTWRILMPKYLGALTIVLLLGVVLTRISVLRRQGIKAMKFGNIDKTDFLIPPFALFYFYVLFAAAFHWPIVTTDQFFHSEIISWTGVLFCLTGLLLFMWSLISFRQSFRVGIDADHPDRLINRRRFCFQS